MPNLVTHTYFADKVAEKLDSNKQEIIARNKDIFYIGSNGPDVFFSFRELKMGVKDMSNKLQSVKTFEVFEKTAEWLQKNYDEASYAYLLGLHCHYALDRVAHPYVNYAIEHGFFKDYEAKYRKSIHTIIEIYFDEYIIRNKLNTTIKDFSCKPLIANTKKDRYTVAKIYQEVINPIYGFNLFSKQIANSILLVNLFHKFTSDKTGRKKKILSLIEKIFFDNYPKLTSFIKPVYEGDKFDFLNNEHRPWRKVRNKSEMTKDSFDDMLNRALLDAIDNINTYEKAINSKAKLDKKSFAVNYEGIHDPSLL